MPSQFAGFLTSNYTIKEICTDGGKVMFFAFCVGFIIGGLCGVIVMALLFLSNESEKSIEVNSVKKHYGKLQTCELPISLNLAHAKKPNVHDELQLCINYEKGGRGARFCKYCQSGCNFE